MATDLRDLLAQISDNATFRAWGSGLSAQLAAVGLVKTTDTGQIDWSTAVLPTTGQNAGYEIWRFNDSLQATKPVFIRIDYGQQSTAGRTSLEAKIATGTNGAGTLTGQIGAQRLLNGNQSKTAGTLLPSFCSGSSSRLSLCTNCDPVSSSYGQVLLVERTKDSSGNDTGDAIVWYGSRGSDASYQVIPFTGVIPTAYGVNMAISPVHTGMSTLSGSRVVVSPTIAPIGQIRFASWSVYSTAALSQHIPVPVTHLGALRTIMPMGASIASSSLSQGDTSTGTGLAILWE